MSKIDWDTNYGKQVIEGAGIMAAQEVTKADHASEIATRSRILALPERDQLAPTKAELNRWQKDVARSIAAGEPGRVAFAQALRAFYQAAAPYLGSLFEDRVVRLDQVEGFSQRSQNDLAAEALALGADAGKRLVSETAGARPEDWVGLIYLWQVPPHLIIPPKFREIEARVVAPLGQVLRRFGLHKAAQTPLTLSLWHPTSWFNQYLPAGTPTVTRAHKLVYTETDGPLVTVLEAARAASRHVSTRDVNTAWNAALVDGDRRAFVGTP
jgi:hypothetical protein